jgi:hypothetical protein
MVLVTVALASATVEEVCFSIAMVDVSIAVVEVVFKGS